MEKYTAIYPRVSTNKQVEHGTSLDYQEEACTRKAIDLGIPKSMIKVYREEGFSGEDIDRPKMDLLRQDIKNGIINRVIITHPDRLSRNMVDRLIVCSEFEKYGVELVFVDTEYKDTEEGKLFFNIQSSIAQYELALIKKRTRRGSISSVQKGYVMPMRVPPFGYDYKDKMLHVNKTEAKFVKMMFQWYVFDKLTIREIGEKLCALGAIPKRKKIPEWSSSSIAKILKNETYIGKFYYNRRQVKKVKGEKTASGKPKRTYTYRDKEEWYAVEVPMIIDAATFSLAQDQRESNIKHSGNVKHEYLLRKKIRCAHCGNKYSSYTSSSKTKSKVTGEVTSTHSYKMYRCTNKTNRKFGENVEKCCSKLIRADYLDEYIWDKLIMNILNKTDDVIESMKNKHEKPSKEVEETYNLLKYKIAKFEEEKKRTIQLFKKAYIDEEEMDRDMNKLNKGVEDLKNEMKKYEDKMFSIGKNELNIEILKNTIEQVKERIDNQDVLSFDLKRKVLDYFIEEIILKWDEKGVKITTIGAIDSLVNEEKMRKLSTQHQSFVDTSNIVFNLVFDTLLMITNSGRDRKYKVVKQEFKIS